MRGRKPKPIEYHIAAGNPSKLTDLAGRRQAEPKALSGKPPKPDWLSADAAAAWDYLAGHLDKMGTLAKCDGMGLALIAQQYKIWVETQKAVDEHGAVINVGGGQLQPSPFLKAADKQAALLTKLLSEFNLTPVGRARMGTAAAAKPSQGTGGIMDFIQRRQNG
jgi:P27 family predicted phage terminase small subunit